VTLIREVTVRVKGKTPLTIHNNQPAAEFQSAINQLMDRRTPLVGEARDMLRWLRYQAVCFHIRDGRPYMSRNALLLPFIHATDRTEEKDFLKSILSVAEAVPIQHDGPSTVKELFRSEFHKQVVYSPELGEITIPVVYDWGFTFVLQFECGRIKTPDPKLTEEDFIRGMLYAGSKTKSFGGIRHSSFGQFDITSIVFGPPIEKRTPAAARKSFGLILDTSEVATAPSEVVPEPPVQPTVIDLVEAPLSKVMPMIQKDPRLEPDVQKRLLDALNELTAISVLGDHKLIRRAVCETLNKHGIKSFKFQDWKAHNLDCLMRNRRNKKIRDAEKAKGVA